MLASLITWKQTRPGLLITAVLEFGFAYLAGSWAIDSGSWWAYLITFVLVIGVISSVVKAIKLKK